MITALIISFILFLVIGMPIAFSIGLAGIVGLMWGKGLPLLLVPQRILVAADSFSLLAIPLFLLAGELMNRGGITKRLVNFSNSLVGHIKGGIGMSSILASMIFAGISGSAVADASAIGSILVPTMTERKYKRGLVASLQACAGTMGPIIPPSILMILYGSITGVSIGGLFLAGFIPGVLIGLGLMLVTYIYASRPGNEGMKGDPWVGWREVWVSFKQAILALVMPVIIIGGIISGIFTATEAGAVAVAYAFIVGTVYQELKWRDLPKMLVAATSTTAMVMLIITTASLFGWLIAREQVPNAIGAFLTSVSPNPAIFLIIVIFFLLLLGCVMEVVAAATIFGPLLYLLGQRYGLDPVFFGLITMVVLQFGCVTPPVGILLNITCGLAKTSTEEACKYLLPYLGVMVVVVAVICIFPDAVMFLPRLFLGQ
jgi:tripartite ATP-independent transporter DctM subunit